MKESERISIIVPVYKVPEKYLRTCIESCQMQTYQNIEILLVADYDKEPDSCTAICKEYAKTDKRICVIEGIKNGLSAGRNKGFRAATGEWIMFVDGDDWIESDMCAHMQKVGAETNAQLVMCGMCKDYNHSVTEYQIFLEDGKVYKGESECRWLQQQLLVYNGNIAVAYAKLIRRSFLIDNDLLHDEELKRGSEGLEFNIRLFERINIVVYIARSFYHYIYNDASFSAAPDEATHQYVLMSFRKIRDSIQKSKNKEALEPWFDNRLLYVIVTTAISGYFSPMNNDPYIVRKSKFQRFMDDPMISKAINTPNYQGISHARLFVLFLIKHRIYWPLGLLGNIRKWQKEHK